MNVKAKGSFRVSLSSDVLTGLVKVAATGRRTGLVRRTA
jgi:hypothetical protein